jgi:hypothetical protein
MSVKQERNPNEPPIVEPKEFLLKPFEKLEVGELIKPPDINFLKWLPKVSDETGLVYQEPRWFVIKAFDDVPNWLMPQNSDILLHSHPHQKGRIQDTEAIPSMLDFFHCSPLAKEFIVSKKGITEYWAVNLEAKQHLEMKIVRGRWSPLQYKTQEYLDFLKRIGAKFKVYSWEELDDEKLAKLFY